MELIVAGAIVLFTFFPNSSEIIQENLSLSPTPTPKPQQATAQTPSPTPTPPGPITHVIEAGETIDSIANKYYGSSKFWTMIWNDNDHIENPTVVRAGEELKIRRDVPTETEELNDDLAVLYEELINPSPTPTPEGSVSTQSREILPAGSFGDVYRDAAAKFGVPWEILYGLHMVETGLRDGPIGNGSGPQGPLQFMPGTWNVYGVDGNGDGVADINNAVDAIHGAANYLAAHGGVEQGLRSYGRVYEKVMDVARSLGYGG